MAALNRHWYVGLVKPNFAPAPWLAAGGTGVLAVSLGLGVLRVLRRPDYLPDRLGAIRMFFISLGLDALWSWLFFAGRHPHAALAAAAALTLAATSASWRFAIVDRLAGLLLAPWIAAAAFILAFNLSIALRNG